MVQYWEIVGGADKGGILVREGSEKDSPQTDARLSTNAIVEEIELKGDRLNYKLCDGTGPNQGWVAIKITGKDLAVKTDKKPACFKLPEKVGSKDESPVKVALLFPGQGSQYVKMLEGVKDMPAVKQMLEKSNDILGYDILQICLEGPESKLEETRYCQPAMFIAGLAAIEKLRADKPEAVERCAVMAGLSLGEYTALCASGVVTFEDGLKLVKLRGEAMQEAATVGSQAMLSVAGLERKVLEPLCKKIAASSPDAVCQIANELFPKGFSVGGTQKAIEELKVLCEKDSDCMQAKILKTGGAFHTPLMKPAQEKLAAAIEDCLPKMQTPKHTMWMNVTARPMHPGTEPKEIVELMKQQLTSAVLWDSSMRNIITAGVEEFYEVGPMKQCKAMMKRIDLNAWKKTTNIEV